ncbi:hypothetical protein [Absidia glauca]|uniref:Uncharacterized protein n=1 Tax=Absidia glauca TaxID=4829 RepID=A0A163JLY8_ABSGL|nr:hypothetical protein [Absidia glauca]
MAKKASRPATKKKTGNSSHKKHIKSKALPKNAPPAIKNRKMPATHLYEAALDAQQYNTRLLLLRQQSSVASMISLQPKFCLAQASIETPLMTAPCLSYSDGGDGLSIADSANFTTGDSCSPLLPTMDGFSDTLASETDFINSELIDDQPYPYLYRSPALFGFLASDDYAFDLWSSELLISYLDF